MSDHHTFIEQAKGALEKLGTDLDDLHRKVATECKEADAWYDEQMTNLRNDWQAAKDKVEKLATDSQADMQASYDQAKSDAENHWKALQSAVQTYRDQVERTIAQN